MTKMIASPFVLLLALSGIHRVSSSPQVSSSANVTSSVPRLSSKATPLVRAGVSNISFEDAVAHAASISDSLQALDSYGPMSLPSGFPIRTSISQLNGAGPVLQTHSNVSVSPDISKMIQALTPTSNGTVRQSIQKRQGGRRVMIVGDSMSEGQQGDVTWRYHMWTWFRDQGLTVDFVGPYSGTLAPPSPNPGPPLTPPPLYNAGHPPSNPNGDLNVDGTYALSNEAGWDSDHFSVWGRAAAVDKGLIQGVLTDHPADLMLLMLGFNDLGWFYSDTYGTLNSIHDIITNSRNVNPNIQIALANIPERLFIGGRQDLVDNTRLYNQLLPGYISQWSTDQSPIHLVRLEETYDCHPDACAAGYDGLHPNELGEFMIANAFTTTLVNDFHIGNSPIAVANPPPSRPLPPPPNFSVFSSPQGVSATWDAVYGAYSYTVRSSLGDGIWDFSPGSVSSNRWDSQWALEGFHYTLSVAAAAGNRVGEFTTTFAADAHPETAPAPSNIIVEPIGDGFTISWDPPTGPYTDDITEYNIIYWDHDPTSCNFISGAAFLNSPGTVTGITPGHRVLVAPVTWNARAGEGFPEIVHDVIPGGGTPGVPSGLQITATDPTSIYGTFDEVPGAAGYSLWIRDTNDPTSVSTRQNVTLPNACFVDYYLFPGAQYYEFCVSAFNGNLESGKSNCITPAQPSSSSAPSSCPAPPGWCTNSQSTGGGGGGGGGGSGSISGGPSQTPIPGSGTTVVGGTTSTAPGGSVTVIGGTTIVGGTTSTAPGGSVTVIGGTTSTSPGGSVTVIGGTTSTAPGGSITVIGGTTIVGGTTSTLPGGGTTVVGGSTIAGNLPGGLTVIGGTTTTEANGSPTIIGGTTIETLTLPDGATTTLTVAPGQTITGLTTITTGGSTLTVGPASPTLTSSNSGMVTSTITTLPPFLSVQDYTDSSITGNEWVTTTGASGSTTIVPIILPCPTCEPEVIWNLPEIPDVEFNWPQLPRLPPFHLPCIKIFGIHVAGECPSPSGPTPVNDGPPPEPEPSESSSRSCTSTATVTDFFVSCTSVNPTSTSCTTTSSFVTAGCRVTASTTTTTSSSSTATGELYIVSSKSGTNPSEFQDFVNMLPDSGKGLFTSYENIPWQTYLTNLTPIQAMNISEEPLVDFVARNYQDFTSDDEMKAVPRQKRAPDSHAVKPRALGPTVNRQGRLDPLDREYHLRLISAEPGITAPLPNYVFDPSLGAGQTIYIIDNGFNAGHPEFQNDGRTVLTYYVGNNRALAAIDRSLWPTDNSPGETDGHGTFVASIAGGSSAGVASNANLVLVKFKQQSKNPLNPSSNNLVLPSAADSAVDDAWTWAINDAVERRRAAAAVGQPPGKFIINMSLGFGLNGLPDGGTGRRSIMNRVLRQAWAEDIITVIATGNSGSLHSLDQFTPSNLGTADNQLITVGGVFSDGTLDDITTIDAGNGGSITVYAVSRDVHGAVSNQVDRFKINSGTSFAAPAVAGLAAYFAGLASLADQFPDGNVAMAMKDYIRQNAIQRTNTPFDNIPDGDYQPRPAPESIVVAYNQAPDGLCDVSVGSKRAADAKRDLRPRQSPVDAASDYDIVVSGTVVDSQALPSVCPLTSGQAPSPTTPASTTPASTTPASTTPASTTPTFTTPTSSASPSPTNNCNYSGNRWGYNIEEVSTEILDPGSCNATAFFACLGIQCGPHAESTNCNYNDGRGIAGTFDTDSPCSPSDVDPCFLESFGVALTCHVG